MQESWPALQSQTRQSLATLQEGGSFGGAQPASTPTSCQADAGQSLCILLEHECQRNNISERLCSAS